MNAVASIDSSSIFRYLPDRGSSAASKKLQDFYDAVDKSLRKAVTWDYTSDALAELQVICGERCNIGWDGYDARPISAATYDDAVRFINAIPSSLDMPEIVPEPDGDIGFEWNYGKNKVFAVSVNGTNKLVYAGILGAGNKSHGVEVFNGTLPQTIISNILRIAEKK